MAKKVILKDQDNVEILPITRGELIVDSSGKEAFHSNEFLATNSQPGLMSPEEKAKLSTMAGNTIDSTLSTTSDNPVQNKVVTVAINEAKQLANDAQETANDASENVSKVQQIINSIKASYLKSATVNGNVLTIVDQSDSEITFTNTTYNTFLKETAANTGGRNGLVPKPNYNDGSKTRFLREDGTWVVPTDTKNTAGSTNSTSKLFLIGATSQAANPQTYSNSSVYTTNGTLYATTFIGNLDGTYVNKLTGYKIAEAIGSISATDSLNTALGKLEFKTDFIYNDLFGTDNDDVINKWHEIVDFVDSVAEGTDITDEFVTRKTDQVITGQKNFNTNTNAKPLIISRSGANTVECVKIGVDDNTTYFSHVQNERNASFVFKGIWTDTEDGTKDDAGEAYVKFNLSSSNKSIVLNDGTNSYTVYHQGNLKNLSDLNDDIVSGKYLPLSGGTLTGPVEIKSTSSGNYNEGLRISVASNNWAGITFGGTGLAGAPTNGWFAALNPDDQFIISPNNSSNTTGLTLNAGGDAKWRNNTLLHTGNYSSILDGRYYTETEVNNLLAKYLPLAGGTMTLGEGLKFHADNNYFGTNSDARIISLLDGNGITCDGGLIIDERCTRDGTEYVTELLRIRDAEFKWKGQNILHSGNSSVSGGGSSVGSSLTVKINGTSATLTIPSNVTSATKVLINQHTANNTEYPIVWSNSNNTTNAVNTDLFKSYNHLLYNPSAHRITTGQYVANNSAGPHFTANSATGSWAYLRLHNGSTYWDIATRSDSGSGGLWLARLSGGDNGIFVSTGNNVGISTSSPSYKLHAAGDIYATGWSRAGSGFYVEGKGVHYMSNNASGLGQIYLTSNEFNWSASGSALYFNYRASANGTTVTQYIWNAGSSSSYASHTLGALTSRGIQTLYGRTDTCNIGNTSTGPYSEAAAQIREYNFGGSQTDTWGNAPRLTWHWSGRVAAQIGLASNGYLYTAPVTGTTFYKLVYESGTWAINISGNANYATSAGSADIWDGRHFSASFAKASDINWSYLMWTAGGACSDVSTMGYAAVMNVGTDLYRGWQIWNSRNDHKLYWRPVKSDASGWADVHTLLDSHNYTSYTDGRYVNVTGDTMTGTLHMKSQTGSYSEGIRIYPYSSWSTLMLLGTDITAASGTSTGSWGLFNNAGTFYINKGNSSGANNSRAMGTSTGWTFGNTSRNSYALNAASFICDSWVRTCGATGWYNESYGGGIYMEDSSWVRTYNGKNFYCSAVIQAGNRFYTGYDAGVANSISCSNWFRSNGSTGWYNPTNECHVYPNNISTYGGLILRGIKSSYHGFLLGTSTSYMNVMSTDTHHGLYCENTGQWEFYYNRSSKGAGILTSTLTKTINLAGQTYISSNTWIGTTSGAEMLNVGGWVGTVGSTGWYNITYAGGMYMQDTTYVRTYNSKALYVSNTGDHAIYTAGGFASARTSGSVFATYYNGTWYCDTLYTHGNGNLSISPPGGSLYLAYNRGNTYFGGGTYYINRSGYFNGTAAAANSVAWANVTGKPSIPTVYSRNIGVNGTNWTFYSSTSAATTSIYAPTGAGTSGYILQSNGSGAPSWTSRLSYSYPGVIWVGYIYRTARSYTTWYASSQGGSASVSMYISSPTSSNNYQVALQSSTHTILGGMCSIQAQFNAGKDGGQTTEGPLYAYSTVDVSKIEEAGPDVLVSSVYGGRFYIKAMRASDANNTSYYFDGLAFTGAGKDTNSLPLARINIILFGY